MRRRVAFAAMLVLAITPVLAVPAMAKDPARLTHERTVAYWTPARIAAAVPRDFIRSGATIRLAPRPAKAPSGNGTAVVGASWTRGGDIIEGTGKVLFTMGGSNYICSGTTTTDRRSGASIVLTAGHCAYDETARAFATNWMFIPNFDASPTYTCSATKYGCWSATALVVHRGYASAGGFNTQATAHDWAFAVVQGGGKTTGSTLVLDATVPTFGISFGTVATGDRLAAFGYPAAGKFRGADLRYCAGNVFQDSSNQNLTWGMACDMTGGSSGGPWLEGIGETTGDGGVLSSLNSYGYGNIRNMYGPKFNSNTSKTWTVAQTASANTIVD
jgi:hypothetical protein